MFRRARSLPRVVGVVGLAGSGKSTVTDILKAKGYEVVYFGGVVLAEVAARGLERTHDNERLVREDLRANEGMAVMAKRSVPVIQQHLAAGRKVAIDGIYSMAEVDVLREALGDDLFIVAIHAPKALRQARSAVRGVRSMTPEELDARDAKELEALDKARPIVLADTHVVNDGGESDLGHRLLEAISDAVSTRGEAPSR